MPALSGEPYIAFTLDSGLRAGYGVCSELMDFEQGTRLFGTKGLLVGAFCGGVRRTLLGFVKFG